MNKSVCFGVLAGGKSSRMGQNKALLSYKGMRFLERIVSCGRDFPEMLLSADSPRRYEKAELQLPERIGFVYDQTDAFGPLEGIYQLLKECKSDYLLAIACDLPNLSQEFVESWASMADGQYDCYVLTIDGDHPEPLCSIYGKGCLEALEDLREQGIHRPRMLFDRVHTKYVDISELGYSAKLLENVNTPEELVRLEKS